MPKILIVEDDRNIANFLSMILLGAGYLCVAASSATAARSLLDSETGIDLVVLDQNLGEESESGLALLTALRRLPKFQYIPVIVCTGDSRTAVITGFLGQRIAGFVKKPFQLERFLSDVQRILGPTETVAAPSEVEAW